MHLSSSARWRNRQARFQDAIWDNREEVCNSEQSGQKYVAAAYPGNLRAIVDAGLILSVPWWKLTRLGHAQALTNMYSTTRVLDFC
jgi:hypothetical protein